MNKKITVMLAISALLLIGAAAAEDAVATKGKVVKIERGVSVPDQGEFDRLTIRTQNGETERLLMGRTGSCPDCVQVGDRVRAQVMAGDGSGTGQKMQSMKVRRTGQTTDFRNESGELLRTRTRNADGTGAGTTAGSANGRGGGRNDGGQQAGTRSGSRTRSRSCGGGGGGGRR